MKRSLTTLARISGRAITELQVVSNVYPWKVTDFLMRRVEEGTYSPEALRQFLPDARELIDVQGFSCDPVGESARHPVTSVVQSYKNRLAIITTHRCLVYCRFCFRKDFVGFDSNEVSTNQLDEALDYLRSHPEVDDILLTGGDPLAIPNSQLIPFLEKVVRIGHLKTIRIHSRAISTRPERID